MSDLAANVSDEEWAARQLCDDGACVGVIGADGRCSVCGTPAREFGGPFRAAPLAAEPAASEATAPTEATAAPSDDDFADRRLCPDGACVGVLGSDGRCKVCGRSE